MKLDVNQVATIEKNVGRNRPRKSLLSRFRKDEEGAAAVEFALVSIPFFLIIFSILEQGFYFLGNRMIEAGVYEVAREVKTRQITALNTSELQFRDRLCSKPIMVLFNCEDLSIDVREIAGFEVPAAPPILADGSLDTSDFGFVPGGRSTINIIRVYYDWPTILDWGKFAQFSSTGDLGAGISDTSYRRIVGTAAFLTEPTG